MPGQEMLGLDGPGTRCFRARPVPDPGRWSARAVSLPMSDRLDQADAGMPAPRISSFIAHRLTCLPRMPVQAERSDRSVSAPVRGQRDVKDQVSSERTAARRLGVGMPGVQPAPAARHETNHPRCISVARRRLKYHLTRPTGPPVRQRHAAPGLRHPPASYSQVQAGPLSKVRGDNAVGERSAFAFTGSTAK